MERSVQVAVQVARDVVPLALASARSNLVTQR